MAAVVRFLFLFIVLTHISCCRPQSYEYQTLYAYLDKKPNSRVHMEMSDYFLVLLVEARHLDYTHTTSLLRTIAKHPTDGSKNGDVGHAWVYLKGKINEENVFLEGGHSGELGLTQAKYFDGMMDYFEAGDANPIRYLWENQSDGFFQWGNGGHRPTYAVKIDLTAEKFLEIAHFIENYPFGQYCLMGNQCSLFVTQVAELAGLEMDDKITFSIEPTLSMAGESLRLWTDPKYSQVTISSPDILECRLMEAVAAGKAEFALDWYWSTHRDSWQNSIFKVIESFRRFPERYYRYRLLTQVS